MSHLEERKSGKTIVSFFFFIISFFPLFWFYSASFQDTVTISSIASNVF